MKNKTREELLVYIDSLHNQIEEIKENFIVKKALDEEKLLQQINLSDAIIDSLPGVFYMFDMNGKFFRWNDNFCKVTGYSGEEIVNMSPWDLFVGSDREHIIERLNQVIKEGRSDANASFVTKGGKRIPYLFTGLKIIIENKKFVIGSGIDISETKKVQTEITLANNMLHAVINTIPVRVFWKNKNLVYLGGNDEFAKDAGFHAASDIVGKKDKDLAWKENAEEYCNDDLKVIRTGKPKVNYEEPQRRRDGSSGCLMTSKVPLYDENGETIGVLGAYWDITEIKKNEQALRESEQRYELVLHATREGIWDWHTNSEKVYYSDQWKAQLGYKPDELENTFETWASLLHPDDSDRMQKEVQDYLENPSGYFEPEFRMRHKNGSYRWISNKAVSVVSEDGKTIRLVGAHTDITSIKKAKFQIEKNVQRLKELNELRNKVLEQIPFEDKLKIITDEVVKIFDADFARIWLIGEGDMCHSCIHAKVKKGPHICKYRDRCLKLISSSGRYTHTNGEFHQRVPFDCYKIGKIASGKDDKFLTNDVVTDPRVHNHEWARELDLVSFAGYKIRLKSGEPIGVLALFSKNEIGKEEDALLDNVSLTISQLYSSNNYEQELKENRQFIESILDVSPDLIYIYDIQDNKNFYSNEGIVNILGYSKKELRKFGDQLISTLMHPEDFKTYINDTFPKYFKLKEKEVIEHEYRMLHKNGSWVWLRSKELIFLYDEEGNAKQIFGIIEDIMAQKDSEIRLKESLHDLERSNKELEHFAYIASHDLQEPLRMVTSFLNLIERKYSDKLDEAGIEYINFAVDGANRMRQLIKDLLIFSRVETKGKEFVEVDLNIVLRNALINLSKSIEESKAIIDMEPLPVISCDESQFTQLFQNLISNAIKFKRDSNPEINIKYESRDNNHIFEFHDNGIGFEEEFSERIFTIFQRLHTRDEYEGTGIGLSLCKRIVERHGGEIWAESEPGNGSVFFISLPYDKK